jgi:glycosyltransferase involved in cell wall biosynthesis
MVHTFYTNIKDNLTIVIPCKNEVNYIGNTLKSISKQDYITGTKVIIADGGSTDGTLDVINVLRSLYIDKLDINLIKGGKVAYGRNQGAELVDTDYVLFMDADTYLFNNDTIHYCLMSMVYLDLDLLTCKIKSTVNDWKPKLAFRLFNFVNKIISKRTPFAVGTFFMTRTNIFKLYGPFDESLEHSEDYFLSKKYRPSEFNISNRYIGQDDRRFKKMGYFGMVKLLIKSFINKNNKDFFKKDVGYW